MCRREWCSDCNDLCHTIPFVLLSCAGEFKAHVPGLPLRYMIYMRHTALHPISPKTLASPVSAIAL